MQELEEPAQGKRIYSLLILGSNFLILLILLFREAPQLFPRETPLVTRLAPVVDICSNSFQGILDDKVDARFYKDEIFNVIKTNPHSSFDFTGDEKIKFVQQNGDNKCRVITQDEQGLRSFDLSLESSTSASFGLLVTNITENSLEAAQL